LDLGLAAALGSSLRILWSLLKNGLLIVDDDAVWRDYHWWAIEARICSGEA
jgi:hypothetical protein